jgi:D-glycero-D-manno-heptose 1,7-bisphosphate phosphatase
MADLRQAVILCGGLGKRLSPYTDTMPKPMIPINGRPFLEYLVEQLREQGITTILLLTGYRGEQIKNHFRDGRQFGVSIAYSEGPVDWDTGRRVSEARSMLEPRFMLLYSDNFIPFRLEALSAFHRRLGRPISVLLNNKANGNIRAGTNGLVEKYDPTRSSPGLDYVEIGYMAVERDPVLKLVDPPDVSFSVVLQRLAEQGNLAGLVSGDQYHSISDPKRWKLAEQYLTPQRVLLLDRDGTINARPPRAEYVHRFEDIRFAPGALEGLQALSKAGFTFSVISNQAGIARKIVSHEAVDDVNRQLRETLLTRGIEITQFYVCPHHWDAGCACRKPAPGLFFEASRDHLLRLDRTIYVGDDPRDCEAAYNAGCPCLYVGESRELTSLPSESMPAHMANTIVDAVPWIVSRYEEWERGA